MLNMTKPSDMPTGGSADVPPLEPGMYPGRISLMMDLGVQEEEKFNEPGTMVKNRKLWLSFTLPTEAYEVTGADGTIYTRQRVVGKAYNMPERWNEKASLCIMFEQLLKDGENWEDLAGVACGVEVGLTGKGKPKVAKIVAPMRGMQVSELDEPPKVIGAADYDRLEELNIPKFLQDIVANRIQ